jgi:hypothetical protein
MYRSTKTGQIGQVSALANLEEAVMLKAYFMVMYRSCNGAW